MAFTRKCCWHDPSPRDGCHRELSVAVCCLSCLATGLAWCWLHLPLRSWAEPQHVVWRGPALLSQPGMSRGAGPCQCTMGWQGRSHS